MKRCLRNRAADRISELPEDLLLQILSLLPTKVVVATSVLSKRWKTIWKFVSKLEFGYHNNQSESAENVCKVLLSNQAPFLESLRLRSSYYDGIDIGMWIEIAYARHVRELDLKVSGPSSFKLPRSFYNCETLETLKLKLCVLVDIPVPSQVCFKFLRTLHLYLVDYKDDASVVNFLSGCPNLENLLVRRDRSDHVETFTIAVPSLQRLEIYDWNDEPEHYVINAPSLKYLKIDASYGIRFSLVEIAPELVDANIIDLSEEIDEKLMRSLTSVKRLSLSLSPLEITFPSSTGVIFHQLVYLELSTSQKMWWNLLTLMINTSPRLQVLELTCLWRSGKVRAACDEKWNQPKKVPECLLCHLETFVWNDYTRHKLEEEEKQVAKYILRNGNGLKKANISIKSLDSNERVELFKELENVVRASNSSCHLLVG